MDVMTPISTKSFTKPKKAISNFCCVKTTCRSLGQVSSGPLRPLLRVNSAEIRFPTIPVVPHPWPSPTRAPSLTLHGICHITALFSPLEIISISATWVFKALYNMGASSSWENPLNSQPCPGNVFSHGHTVGFGRWKVRKWHVSL